MRVPVSAFAFPSVYVRESTSSLALLFPTCVCVCVHVPLPCRERFRFHACIRACAHVPFYMSVNCEMVYIYTGESTAQLAAESSLSVLVDASTYEMIATGGFGDDGGAFLREKSVLLAGRTGGAPLAGVVPLS